MTVAIDKRNPPGNRQAALVLDRPRCQSSKGVVPRRPPRRTPDRRGAPSRSGTAVVGVPATCRRRWDATGQLHGFRRRWRQALSGRHAAFLVRLHQQGRGVSPLLPSVRFDILPNQRCGRLPSSYDWSRTHARRRGGDALERLAGGAWPSASVVGPLFAAICRDFPRSTRCLQVIRVGEVPGSIPGAPIETSS